MKHTNRTLCSRTTSFTFFPYTDEGNARFDFFKQVVGFHPIKRTLNAIDWQIGANPGQFMLALLTFLYVDILDSGISSHGI